MTSYAEQQVQRIQNRVLSRPHLRRIIYKFKLYQDQLEHKTWSKIFKDMNEDISVELISAEVVDPRSGRPTTATIAFQVGFGYESPLISQRVANELVSLFLKENMKKRTESAIEASTFFAREADKLRKRMDELDDKLLVLKKENGNSLPEFQQQNTGQLERAYQRLEDINSQYNKAYENKIFLQSQLAVISPYSNSAGANVLDDRTRLKQLQIEYSNLIARYSPNHPDIIKVKTEIEALSSQGSNATNRQTLRLTVKEAKTKLSKLKKSYSPEHPDVISLVKEIQNLETQIASIKTQPNLANTDDADNPAYIQTQAQLKGAELEIISLESSRKAQNKRIEDYEKRLSVSPEVERQYNELMRNYTSNKIKYEQIQSKLMSVNLSESVEKSSKGERYVISEPPELPEEPTKPNRGMVITLGLILSAAAAMAAAALAENLDQGIYGARQIAAANGENPLSVVPYMLTTQEHIAQQKFKRRLLLTLLFLIVTAVLVGYFLYVNGLPDWLSKPGT
jgi:uncharacterized protein involved in exopolysaccharide biosynthesis